MSTESDVSLKTEIDTELALLYSGFRKPFPEEWKKKAEDLCQDVRKNSSVQSTWRLFELDFREDGIHLKGTDTVLKGRLAQTMLRDSDRAVLMAGTLGAAFDRRLNILSLTRPQDALLFDALGSAAVEAVMDQVEKEILDVPALKNCFLTDRFSCGYGDLPLSAQQEISDALSLSRTCGIYLSDSLMMNPTKSITAVAGISDRAQPARIRGCDYCTMNSTCKRKEGGKPCGIS